MSGARIATAAVLGGALAAAGCIPVYPPARYGPPPAFPRIAAEGLLITRLMDDRDGDGRADEWLDFKGGRLAARAVDTDGDGVEDLRLVFPADLEVRSVYEQEGRFCFLDESFRGWPPVHPAAKLARRAGGDWQDTFTLTLTWPLPPEREGAPPGQASAEIAAEKGALQSLKIAAGGARRTETAFAAGGEETLTYDEKGVVREKRQAAADGGRKVLVDEDGDGEFELEFSGPAAAPFPAARKLVKGKWEEDFVRERRQPDGTREVTTYQKGRPVLVRRLAESGAVAAEVQLREGQPVAETYDRDGDGRGEFHRALDPASGEMMAWLGEASRPVYNFSLPEWDLAGMVETVRSFSGGRLVQEKTVDRQNGWVTVVERLSPLLERVSGSGRRTRWVTYDLREGARIPVRESWDTDGDGWADVEIDFDRTAVKPLAMLPRGAAR